MKLSELRKEIPKAKVATEVTTPVKRIGGFTCDNPQFEAIVEDEETGVVKLESVDDEFRNRWLRPSFGGWAGARRD